MALTIGSITKKIKSNQQNVKITLNVNPEFEQTNVIKKRLKQNLNKLVNEETNIDSGDIIVQRSLIIDKNDDINALKNKIHKIEHIAYIEAIKKVL